jgi:hypothetical protein
MNLNQIKQNFKDKLLANDYRYYSRLNDWERVRYFSHSDDEKYKELLFYYLTKPFRRV